MPVSEKGRDLMLYTKVNGKISPTEIYIARANQHIIGRLNCNSAKITMNLLDIWELDIEVDKLLQPNVYNKHYGKIQQYMEIYVKEIGWFRINGEPEEHFDYASGRIYKTFTAYGYETQLQDMHLTEFYINTGEAISREMYPENLDAFEVPINNIRFYIPDANDDLESKDYYGLGLLNILEKEFLSIKGWSIGEVDMELQTLRGRTFSIDDQDVYSFLTQDVMASYKCVIIFDRMNKKVNAYKVENLGKSLNIEFNKRNVLNTVTVSGQDDYSYTEFSVYGGNDEATIAYWNFGSNKIQNINYHMNGQLSTETAGKYQTYTEYKDSRRQEYADTVTEWLELEEKINVLYDQVPIDECKTSWGKYELDELQEQLEQFQAMQTSLENKYTVDGVLQIEGTKDYATYLSIKEVIIPSIQNTITAKENGTEVETIDYETNWELYGIDELNSKKTVYENQRDLLIEGGYDKTYDELTEEDQQSVDEETHNKQHEKYLQIVQYIDEITERVNYLQAQADELESQQEDYETRRKNIVADVAITNERFGFTEEELSDINSLLVGTSYTDSTIEVQDNDDIETIIELSKELFDSANEELERKSRPQLKYVTDIENIFRIGKFSQKVENFSLGDFCYMEIEDDQDSEVKQLLKDDTLDLSSLDVTYSDGVLTINDPLVSYDAENEELVIDIPGIRPKKIKQRIISISAELVDLSDTGIDIEFSDMVMFRGSAADYDYLLGGGSGSDTTALTGAKGQSIISGVALQVLNNYLGSGASIFPNGISDEDAQKLADILDGLVEGNLSLEQLKVKLAQVDRLEANCAFIKYLDAQYLVADQAEFQELKAQVAEIDSLLAGTVSTETAHIIHLTADNCTIDEAVIKNLIAKQITVNDLQASNIILNEYMQIVSDNGQMLMNGQALQIMGKDANGNDYVGIQLGYDTEEKPSLILRDETGAVMLDAQGLHENIVPDGLIKNDMIAESTINKDRLNFTAIEENEDGSIDVTEVYVNGEGIYAKYVSIGEDVVAVKSEVDAVNKSITDEVWRDSIVDVVDKDGNTVSTSIESTLVQHSIDINGLTSIVKDVQSGTAPGLSDLTERVSKLEQTSEGFQQTVKETYLAKTDLDISARNLLRNSKTLIYDDYSISKI